MLVYEPNVERLNRLVSYLILLCGHRRRDSCPPHCLAAYYCRPDCWLPRRQEETVEETEQCGLELFC